jgi:ATP-dependent DNA helicase RecG
MYGDLDVSRITELPKGRIKVDTYVVDEAYRARLNDFIRKQVALGGQCYVICPAIDEASDDEEGLVPTSISAPFSIDTASSPVKNVTLYQDELKAALPELRIAALHGKMKAAEKDSVMSLFEKGEIDVLVSTTVIEVGINVPNASLMVVENAERFGLSQLHQLRGRVGRGTRKSYCVLVSGTDSLKSRERLNVMKSTSDGFEIAERDLMLRGPGDVFSQNSDNNMRQSGGFEFKFAKLCDDPGLMETAFAVSKRIAESDPALERIENAPLKKIVNDMAKSLIPYVS